MSFLKNKWFNFNTKNSWNDLKEAERQGYHTEMRIVKDNPNHEIPYRFIDLEKIKERILKAFPIEIFETRFQEGIEAIDHLHHETKKGERVEQLLIITKYDNRYIYKRLDVGKLYNMPIIISDGLECEYVGLKYRGALEENVREVIGFLCDVYRKIYGEIPTVTMEYKKQHTFRTEGRYTYNGFDEIISTVIDSSEDLDELNYEWKDY